MRVAPLSHCEPTQSHRGPAMPRDASADCCGRVLGSLLSNHGKRPPEVQTLHAQVHNSSHLGNRGRVDGPLTIRREVDPRPAHVNRDVLKQSAVTTLSATPKGKPPRDLEGLLVQFAGERDFHRMVRPVAKQLEHHRAREQVGVLFVGDLNLRVDKPPRDVRLACAAAFICRQQRVHLHFHVNWCLERETRLERTLKLESI
mmetsp:Transcript_29389/g.82083  ORF Transcript_29389/g.82083 Transcript_29389/m.82083 type:complete len:201 (-) Transcript_29389:24-626(-)